MSSYTHSRTALYVLLLSFSVVVLTHSAGRRRHLDENWDRFLYYMPRDRITYETYEALVGLPMGQVARYEKILTEVIVASLGGSLWALYAVLTLAGPRRWKMRDPTVAVEISALFAIWTLMLGAAVLTHVERGLWYDYSSDRTVYQRYSYPYAFTCWFSGSCDELRAMVALSWASWIVLTLLIVLAIAGPASNGALLPFMVSMYGSKQSKTQETLVLNDTPFKHRAAIRLRPASRFSPGYPSTADRASTTEASRLLEATS
ncbi:hypothetical protein PENSPDRAFT_664066 [Peniophora sp. CONT]|nr:hypothetical protein PENSPDRAFT_664066 [Peniophora sp. CONT]